MGMHLNITRYFLIHIEAATLTPAFAREIRSELEIQCHVLSQSVVVYTYPQCMSWMGIKKPLVNPATLEITGERRTALLGKAQMRAMRREIQA